jgi:ADP-ribose pyrophosphatase YjhB (NUDIX family)
MATDEPGRTAAADSDVTGTTQQPRPVRVRHAARVLLLDPAGRVLLMRYDDDSPNGRHWSTPGGGLDPGEDYRTAAARELAEETGWHDIELLSEVHRRAFDMAYRDVTVHQIERIYLARTSPELRPISGVAAMHASDGIAAWRWWTPAELADTAETIWPAELAALIQAIGRSSDGQRR